MADDKYNAFERDMLGKIEEHGWFAMQVFDPDQEFEPFAYSIGFTHTLKAPEFIIFGLPKGLMRDMLWRLFRQIEAGAKVEHGKRWAGIIAVMSALALKLTIQTFLKSMRHLPIGFGKTGAMRGIRLFSRSFGLELAIVYFRGMMGVHKT